ncbi:MAG: hypothetical protein ACQEUM_07350 [Pseudomonadota bacterium]
MDPQQGPQQRQMLVEGMLDVLYGPMLDQARTILEQHQDEPVKGMARILAQLITVTWRSLAEQGKTAPPGVVVQAAMVVAQAVGEMAIQLGLIDEQDSDTIEAAFMLAMGEFGKATAEQMPQGHRQRYGELLGAIRDGREQAMGGGQRQQTQQGGQPPAQGAPQPQQPGNAQGGM